MSLPKTAIEVENFPNVPDADKIYIVKQNGHQRCVVMRCPCNCGDILQMPLLKGDHPYWQITNHSDGTISLSPAINKTIGCRSHFSLQHGLIIWCK